MLRASSSVLVMVVAVVYKLLPCLSCYNAFLSEQTDTRVCCCAQSEAQMLTIDSLSKGRVALQIIFIDGGQVERTAGLGSEGKEGMFLEWILV